jgi:hypothetical protein
MEAGTQGVRYPNESSNTKKVGEKDLRPNTIDRLRFHKQAGLNTQESVLKATNLAHKFTNPHLLMSGTNKEAEHTGAGDVPTVPAH